MKRQVLLSMVALSLITLGCGMTAFASPTDTKSADTKPTDAASGDNKTAETKQAVVKKEQKRPHMDLAFCIDTTGSMQNEIDQVKSKVKSLVAKLASGKPAPIVRVGMVAYRDRGDAYVVKSYPFTEDIDQFVKDVSDLKAAGGGDGPEAVNQGLHAAVNDLKWAKGDATAKLLFLIGDAPPNTYKGDFAWSDEAKHAIASGIQINTIACAGLEVYPQEQGVEVWKKIAKLADGQFDTLTYHAETINAKGEKETVISSAGAVYKVRSSASSEWKSGLSSLMARGAVDKMADSPMVSSGSKSAGLTRASAYREAAGAMAMPMAAPASADFARGKAEVSGISSVGRGDSNLDDIMVNAARARAKKVLKVDYSH
ncbi:MAG: VWA domain-containing protein [Candidatus Obscuribacter sp.]|nr:VWA domain-containing protein [Candidatus Obscuribacter sp.]